MWKVFFSKSRFCLLKPLTQKTNFRFQVGFNWWSPSLINYALRNEGLTTEAVTTWKSAHSVIQPIAGALGIILPNELSIYLKSKGYLTADTYLFAFSFSSSSLFLYVYLYVIDLNEYVSIVVFTLTIFCFNICWVIQSKLLLGSTHPKLRSTANSLSIFILHALGDDISPYWSGLIADACLSSYGDRSNVSSVLLYCTKASIYPFVIMSMCAASLALFMSLTFVKDNAASMRELPPAPVKVAAVDDATQKSGGFSNFFKRA
jgi:hypothetical protein